MIGQLEIKKARKYSKDNLGDKFSLRDFHYQVNFTFACTVLYYGFYKLPYKTKVCSDPPPPPKKETNRKTLYNGLYVCRR